MNATTCSRCGQERPGLGTRPLPNELGARIAQTICRECWQAWLQQQTAIINHYALDLRDPNARKFLTEQTEAFLFGPVEG